MFLPYELEGKVFKKVMKGYNTAEVDEHIEFLLDKYKELYRAYKELEKKYSGVKAELMTYKENEESIRQTLESSRETGAQMMTAAKDRSEIILKTAREECDAVISDFKKQVEEQMNLYDEMKAKVSEFKKDIFEQYQRHIEYLESISPDEEETSHPDIDEIRSETVGKIVIKSNRRIVDRNFAPNITTDNSVEDGIDIYENSDVGEDAAAKAADAAETAENTDTEKTDMTDAEKADGAGNAGEHKEDTMEYPVIPEISAEVSRAEDIIFGNNQ